VAVVVAVVGEEDMRVRVTEARYTNPPLLRIPGPRWKHPKTATFPKRPLSQRHRKCRRSGGMGCAEAGR